jgi:uncharacterized protein (DUF58 family)
MTTRIVLEKLPTDPSGSTEYQLEHFKRHRVYIFPTIQGWMYGIMLIVMLLGAINYNNSMAYVLCFLLCSLGVVCMLHTYRNLSGLILSSSKPKAVFVGQQARFPIQLDNRFGLEKFSINLQQKEKVKFSFKKRVNTEQVSFAITPDKNTTVYYPIETKQRGLLKSPRLKISTNFPLGLFNAWSYYNPGQECVIYPEPLGNEHLPLYTSTEDDADSGSQSGTDDFAGFRKYKAGDPIHSIAWKAFSKEQGLLTKQFSGKGSKTLILNWDSVENINTIESRLSQLCYWILLAEKSTIHYGLEIPDFKINPGHGSLHKEKCLEALARYGNT